MASLRLPAPSPKITQTPAVSLRDYTGITRNTGPSRARVSGARKCSCPPRNCARRPWASCLLRNSPNIDSEACRSRNRWGRHHHTTKNTHPTPPASLLRHPGEPSPYPRGYSSPARSTPSPTVFLELPDLRPYRHGISQCHSWTTEKRLPLATPPARSSATGRQGVRSRSVLARTAWGSGSVPSDRSVAG